MDHFAGLDVSVNETSVCIVDDTGRIVREVKVASEPDALLPVLTNPAYHFKRIGLEAGPLSQWLFSALAEAELPVVCVETRHMPAVLKAQINKTDRNDARDVANAQSEFLRSRAFPINAAFDDIFLAIGWRNVRWISIEIGSPNAILRPVLVDPLPQQVRCDPSFSPRRTLGAHDVGCKPVSIAATPAAAMI